MKWLLPGVGVGGRYTEPVGEPEIPGSRAHTQQLDNQSINQCHLIWKCKNNFKNRIC